MALLIIAFLAGILTVLAPCILPLLPIIVGGSIAGKPDRARALTIVLSLCISVFLFTILLKASTAFISVPEMFWQIVSGGLLIIFGLVTLFPSLWEKFSFANTLNQQSNRVLAGGYTRKNFYGDIIIGAALGPVFSSCSPTYFIVLATVLPAHPAQGALYLLAYSVGLSLSLFGVAIAGQKIVLKLGLASDPRSTLKRTIGALFLIIGIAILSGWDKQIEASILSHSGIFDVTQIEQRLLGGQGTGSTQTPTLPVGQYLTPAQKALVYTAAPELVKPDAYLNTGGQPITLAQFKGKKVVLIDFWTYSCINCLRTIPFVEALYQKYGSNGLVVVGVHTPEFAFEHIQQNVADAVARLGITYPVILDNEYTTWNAFGNQFWPREYLIDIDGYIAYDHTGEGDEGQIEKAVQTALAEHAARLGTTEVTATSTINIPQSDLSAVGSSETYFGSDRNEFLANGMAGNSGVQTFSVPTATLPNELYLGGTWDIQPEYAESQSTSADIMFSYSAHDVYLVASAAATTTIEVLRDGKPVGTFGGSDVDPKTNTASIQAQKLYRLVHDEAPGNHTIEIHVQSSGLRAYTFTFG